MPDLDDMSAFKGIGGAVDQKRPTASSNSDDGLDDVKTDKDLKDFHEKQGFNYAPIKAAQAVVEMMGKQQKTAEPTEEPRETDISSAEMPLIISALFDAQNDDRTILTILRARLKWFQAAYANMQQINNTLRDGFIQNQARINELEIRLGMGADHPKEYHKEYPQNDKA